MIEVAPTRRARFSFGHDLQFGKPSSSEYDRISQGSHGVARCGVGFDEPREQLEGLVCPEPLQVPAGLIAHSDASSSPNRSEKVPGKHGNGVVDPAGQNPPMEQMRH